MKKTGEKFCRIAAYVLALLLLVNSMSEGSIKANTYEEDGYAAAKEQILSIETLKRVELRDRDILKRETSTEPSGTGGAPAADAGEQNPDISGGEGGQNPDISGGEGGKKPIPGFKFQEEKPEITYEEGITYSQTPTGADGENYIITYVISAGEGEQAVADIDGKTGVVTPKRAGTVVIVATCKDKDEKYLDTTASYELTIHKGNRNLVFEHTTEDGSPIEIKYGQVYRNAVLAAPGDGEVFYEIEPEGKGVTVESDGTISYQNVTEEPMTVRAVKREDDCYAESVAEYRLKIVYQELPENAYEIVGDKGKNDWYQSDVSVRPQNGYEISQSNALGEDNTWLDFLTFREEGVRDICFYLRSPEGYITDKVTLSELKIDKTAPDGLKISYSDLPVNSRQEYEDTESDVVDYYNKDKIEVTLTVSQESENGSGIVSLTYYTNELGEGKGTVIPIGKCSVNADQTISYTFTCAAIFRGRITFEAEDAAGWMSKRYSDGKVIVVDNKQSKISVEYDDSKLVRVTDSVTLEDIENYRHPGSKNVNLYYSSAAGDGETVRGGVKILTYTISEDFFYPDDAQFTLYVNGTEAGNYETYAFLGDTESENGAGVWRRSGEKEWQIDLVLKEGGDYVAKMSYEDRSQNGEVTVVDQTEHIYVDGSRPEVNVTYSAHSTQTEGIVYYQGNPTATIAVKEKNFRASDVKVTVTAKDANGKEVEVSADANGQSFSDYVKDSAHWETAEGVKENHILILTFSKDADYTFDITYTDLAGNASVYGSGKEEAYPQDHFIVDNAPMKKAEQTVNDMYAQSFTRVVDGDNEQIITPQEAVGSRRWIYDDTAEITFLFEEANFYGSDVQANIDGADAGNNQFIEVWRDNVKCASMGDGYRFEGWSGQEDGDANLHMLSLKIGTDNADGSKDGDYLIVVRYTDRSGNSMQEYRSDIITIDTTLPVITVNYDNNAAKGGSYYKKERIATLQVKDRNIRPEEMIVVVSGFDIMGNEIKGAGRQSEWKQSAGKKDIWTCTYAYDTDANYRFSLACTDMAEHQAKTADAFTVDLTKPAAGDITISYSASLLQKVLSGITFGYYQPKVTVTVTAEDVISGIDYLDWEYQKEDGSSGSNVAEESGRITTGDITYSEDKKTATAKFTIKATKARQYAGYVKVRATDRAGNTGNYRTDNGTEIVVDTISPTRTVTYSPAKQVVNQKTGATISDFQLTSENRNMQLYYDDSMTVTFVVKEANFYAEDVTIKVNDKKKKVTWKKSEDEEDTWQGNLKIKNEGDYVVTMEYTDRSGNAAVSDVTGKANTYRSGVITIDNDVPAIAVDYTPRVPVGIIEGTNYYNSSVSAVITIREHNFRASDVNAVVTAVNVSGESVEIQDYNQYLKAEENWTSDGDIHRATVSYPTDAVYTMNVDYTDLAGRTAAYGEDKFIVDTGKPENLGVEYSANLFETILESVTFGFYKAQMTVTLTADDSTAGIHQFVYSYLKSNGVSDVNAELIEGVIAEDEIEFSGGGKTATARFSIPRDALQGDNQFNGTVEFTVADRCGWEAELTDKTRIIVDSISPTADIQYNEPVRQTEGISYYNGEIEASIEITEANFYEEDVEVSVAKDGGAPSSVQVSWTDASVDRHVGTFTLSQDGDYIVTVNYEDRSSNAMEEYQSEQLTIDTAAPTLELAGIGHHSANNKETIGFVLTVDDVNLDMADFQPLLEVQLRDENGRIYTKDVSEIGTKATVTSGSRYTYTVTNLEQDGVYTLSCPVTDLADNQMEMIRTEAGGETEQIVFSVNRNGSTYKLDNATNNINGTFAQDEIDAVITEINVDEISDHQVTLFKNEGTFVLSEGSDYTMKKEGGEETWHSCTYTVLKDNFKEDGTYRLALYSKDKTEAENTLATKNVEVSFVIDKTDPNLIVANLENGKTYPVPELTVILQATDNMGLKSISAKLDGKTVDLQKRENGDDIEAAGTGDSGEREPDDSGEDKTDDSGNVDVTEAEEPNGNGESAEDAGKEDFSVSGGDYEFTIAGTSTDPHQVEIVLTDLAGRETIEVIEDFYVTTNKWVRFTHNRPLFFGTIAGIVVLIAVPAAVVAVRRRKKGSQAKG